MLSHQVGLPPLATVKSLFIISKKIMLVNKFSDVLQLISYNFSIKIHLEAFKAMQKGTIVAAFCFHNAFARQISLQKSQFFFLRKMQRTALFRLVGSSA